MVPILRVVVAADKDINFRDEFLTNVSEKCQFSSVQPSLSLNCLPQSSGKAVNYGLNINRIVSANGKACWVEFSQQEGKILGLSFLTMHKFEAGQS